MGRLPRVTGKDMVRFLQRQGFTFVGIRGSHHYFQKEHLRTTVAVHGNRNIKIGTLHGILRDIRMSPAEFEKLWNE